MTCNIRQVESVKGLIKLFTLTNSRGASVTLSSLGAGIVEIKVPDRDDVIQDIVVGYANPTDYIYDGPCAGKIPGRFANRIANGHFSLDGNDYTLKINCGPNALHGGPEGFHNQNWDSHVNGNKVIFSYFSKDGEEGYPGNLKVTATYKWADDNRLTLDIRATTDAPTVINLTNHSYFNLDGDGSESALDHVLQLNASRYLPTDPSLVPTGEFAPVTGTPMDFTMPKAIRQDIDNDFKALRDGKGYDHCWIIDRADGSSLTEAACLWSERSGRCLTILTTQPAVQVYSGNWLAGSPTSKTGIPYRDYSAIAIECQGLPDAPNHENFPSATLRPGEEYHQTIVFAFSVKN